MKKLWYEIEVYAHWLKVTLLKIFLHPFCLYRKVGAWTVEYTDGKTEEAVQFYEDSVLGFREVRVPLKYVSWYFTITWLIIKWECYSWTLEELNKFMKEPCSKNSKAV